MVFKVVLIVVVGMMLFGCAFPSSPDEPLVEVGVTTGGSGDVDVDVNVTTQEVDNGGDQNGDVNNGGCCDDASSNSERCFSVPSGTEVPCETCIQEGGNRECSIGAPISQ